MTTFDPNAFLRNVLQRNRQAAAQQQQQQQQQQQSTPPVEVKAVVLEEQQQQQPPPNKEEPEQPSINADASSPAPPLTAEVSVDGDQMDQSEIRRQYAEGVADDDKAASVSEAPLSKSKERRPDRSRSRHRTRSKSRNRSRSRHRERRDRSRSRHRSRSRKRRRDSSRDRRVRSPARERRRERTPERYRRSRPAPPPAPSSYSSRRRSRSPPIRGPTIMSFEEEMERLDRTLCIMQISNRIRNRDLIDFFEGSGVGRVREVRIVKDSRSGASKGVAYVEFADLESVEKALRLNGSKLMGAPCTVQRCESEKQLLLQQVQNGSFGNPQITDDSNLRKIYVAGLNPKLSKDEIRPIFEAFGTLTFIDLQFDQETRKFKGIATIGFRNPVDAKNAVITMNGFPLADRTIRVGWVRERSGPIMVGMDFERIDDDGCAALGQINRTQLMAKLARERGIEMPGFPLENSTDAPSQLDTGVMTSTLPAPAEQATRNCLLRNMFNPAEETEPGWQDEIKADVSEECSKFGTVVHAAVDPDDPDGCVYVRFDTVEACENALHTLDGRWFAQKQISAKFVVDAIYDARFHLN